MRLFHSVGLLGTLEYLIYLSHLLQNLQLRKPDTYYFLENKTFYEENRF